MTRNTISNILKKVENGEKLNREENLMYYFYEEEQEIKQVNSFKIPAMNSWDF